MNRVNLRRIVAGVCIAVFLLAVVTLVPRAVPISHPPAWSAAPALPSTTATELVDLAFIVPPLLGILFATPTSIRVAEVGADGPPLAPYLSVRSPRAPPIA